MSRFFVRSPILTGRPLPAGQLVRGLGGVLVEHGEQVLLHEHRAVAFTNILILLTKGFRKTVAAFGLRNFLDDIGCKIIVYLERVARGLSICTSSLLTVVQAIIISPRASGWRRLRLKSAWHILLFFLFFWILNALISEIGRAHV